MTLFIIIAISLAFFWLHCWADRKGGWWLFISIPALLISAPGLLMLGVVVIGLMLGR